jgi:hypothetical protein
LAGEPGKQSQKVHRRHRSSPIQFLAQPHRQRTGEISPTAYFPDPLAAVVNGITPTSSTASGPIRSSAALHHFTSSLQHHHQNQMLIVATIKPKQFTLAIRNELAVSVVMENSQLAVIQLDLTPIGS